jgi:hypothetical protein
VVRREKYRVILPPGRRRIQKTAEHAVRPYEAGGKRNIHKEFYIVGYNSDGSQTILRKNI